MGKGLRERKETTQPQQNGKKMERKIKILPQHDPKERGYLSENSSDSLGSSTTVWMFMDRVK